jgi:EamA domain-containing membrane protein RarD
MDKHTTEMAIAQVAAIGLSMSDVEQWLRITSLVIAISFGVYKWVEKITKKDK